MSRSSTFAQEETQFCPGVAEYWGQHCDIATILRKNWKEVGPLNGKIHLTVGTAPPTTTEMERSTPKRVHREVHWRVPTKAI